MLIQFGVHLLPLQKEAIVVFLHFGDGELAGGQEFLHGLNWGEVPQQLLHANLCASRGVLCGVPLGQGARQGLLRALLQGFSMRLVLFGGGRLIVVESAIRAESDGLKHLGEGEGAVKLIKRGGINVLRVGRELSTPDLPHLGQRLQAPRELALGAVLRDRVCPIVDAREILGGRPPPVQ